jgi:hypothetical protein
MDDYLSSRQEHTSARSSTRPVIVALIGAFALGGALAGYGVYRFGDWANDGASNRVVSPAVRATPILPPSPTPSATMSEAAQEAAQAVERVAEQQGGLDQRIAAAEQRIARLDLQAQAAAGNAARAEGLLIAFSARRALDRGADLGFLADQLRLRFGDAMPNAVQTVVTFGRNPVTLDELIARLDGMAPDLANNNRGFSWEQLGNEISQLFVVRRETTPSPQPRLRLERARLFLQSGRVDAAVAEVRNLPGAANASDWIRDARRYAAAQNALDLIETAAVLEPRRLRDGAGNPIEQASPAIAVPALPPAR